MKGFQVLLNVSPNENLTGQAQMSFQLFTKHQGEKAAKDMTANDPITLMKDRGEYGPFANKHGSTPARLGIYDGPFNGI